MKKIIQVIFLLLFVMGFHACQEEKGEVVSQDWVYQLDPDYIHVDIPDEFQFDPSNILYLKGSTALTLTGRNDLQSTTIAEGNVVTFDVKIKKAFDKDLTVRLVEDETLLDEYAGDKNGFKKFPESTFSIPETVLRAGETEVSTTLTLTNLNELSEMPGYLLPLRLELADKVEGIKVSVNSYSVIVKLNIMIERENIDSSNEKIEGTLFNDIVTFESSESYGIQYLKDGNTGGSSWYPGTIKDYLLIKLPEPQLIKGICVNTNTNYRLGRAKVFTEANGSMLSEGAFNTNTTATVIYIRFKVPVLTKTIRLEEMLTKKGSTGPDFYELNLIK